MNKKISNSQKGQALIVIVFVLLVVSLVILAVSARSITDVRISETSEDSARAFAAAEAGVERAVGQIRTAVENNTNPPSGAQNIVIPGYTVTPAGSYTIIEPAGSGVFMTPDPLAADLETFQVYLANWNDLTTGNYRGNQICLMWGDVGASGEIPAIEASVIYRNTSGQAAVARFPIDPDGARRTTNNFIAESDDGVGGACNQSITATDSSLGTERTFAYRHKLSLRDVDLPGIDTCDAGPPRHCVQLLRVRLLYNSAAQHVGVQRHGGPPNDLPLQGHLIESTGEIGEAARKVRVYRSLESLPTIFDFAIFSGSSDPIIK